MPVELLKWWINKHIQYKCRPTSKFEGKLFHVYFSIIETCIALLFIRIKITRFQSYSSSGIQVDIYCEYCAVQIRQLVSVSRPLQYVWLSIQMSLLGRDRLCMYQLKPCT